MSNEAKTKLVDVDKLKALLERATPGPWEVGIELSVGIYGENGVMIADKPTTKFEGSRYFDSNAALIVAAANSLPDLLKERAELIAFVTDVATAMEYGEHGSVIGGGYKEEANSLLARLKG